MQKIEKGKKLAYILFREGERIETFSQNIYPCEPNKCQEYVDN